MYVINGRAYTLAGRPLGYRAGEARGQAGSASDAEVARRLGSYGAQITASGITVNIGGRRLGFASGTSLSQIESKIATEKQRQQYTKEGRTAEGLKQIQPKGYQSLTTKQWRDVKKLQAEQKKEVGYQTTQQRVPSTYYTGGLTYGTGASAFLSRSFQVSVMQESKEKQRQYTKDIGYPLGNGIAYTKTINYKYPKPDASFQGKDDKFLKYLKVTTERRTKRGEYYQGFDDWAKTLPITFIGRGLVRGLGGMAISSPELILTPVESMSLYGLGERGTSQEQQIVRGALKKSFYSTPSDIYKSSKEEISTKEGAVAFFAPLALAFAAPFIPKIKGAIPEITSKVSKPKFQTRGMPFLKEFYKVTDKKTQVTTSYLVGKIPFKIKSRPYLRTRTTKGVTDVGVKISKRAGSDVAVVKEQFQIRYKGAKKPITGEVKGLIVDQKGLKDFYKAGAIEKIGKQDFIATEAGYEWLKIKVPRPIFTETGRVIPKSDIRGLASEGQIYKPFKSIYFEESLKPIFKGGRWMSKRVRTPKISYDLKTIGTERNIAFVSKLVKPYKPSKYIISNKLTFQTARTIPDIPLTPLNIVTKITASKAGQIAGSSASFKPPTGSAIPSALSISGRRIRVQESPYAGMGLYERTEGATAITQPISETQIQSQISKQTTGLLPKLATSQLTKQLSKQTQKELLRPLTKQSVKQLSKQTQKQLSKQTQKQAQKQVARQLTKQVTKQVGKITPSQTVTKVPPPFLFYIPKINFDFRQKKRLVKIVPTGRYVPSYSALFFKIFGKAPTGTETGVRLRPITSGFNWNQLVNPSRSRKRIIKKIKGRKKK